MTHPMRMNTYLCLGLVAIGPISAQVITRSNSGLTTGEAILVANVDQFQISPFYELSFISAQDVDGNGKLDLLVGVPGSNNSLPPETRLLLNTGNQNFQSSTVSSSSYCQPAYTVPAIPRDSAPPFCILADLNGDGMPDRIFASETANTAHPPEVDNPSIGVAYATGPGTFSAVTKYTVGGNSQFITSVVTGDFNGDGRTDIAVLRVPQNPPPGTGLQIADIVVLIANGSGGFTALSAVSSGVFQAGGLFFEQVAALDLNGDGKSDLIVYDGSGDSFVSVFFGTATGLSEQPQITALMNARFQIEVAADLNHDGYGDVVAIEDDGVHVLLGGPAGTVLGYFASDTILVPSEQFQQTLKAVASADFNNDGLPDLAVTTMNDVTIYKQGSHGTFSRLQEYPAGGLLALGDFDGDGNLDLAVGGNPVQIIYGQGNGYFHGAAITSNHGQAGSIVAGDFNHDGIPDVASGGITNCTFLHGCTNFVSIFLGSGPGWFSPPVFYKVPFNNNVIGGEMGLAVADLNGDDKLDLLVRGFNIAGSTVDTAVLLGKGDGTFLAANGYTVNVAGGGPILLRDMDNDGKMDLIGNLGIAYGKGDGTFGTVIPFPLGAPYEFAVGDFNRDGRPDVLFNRSFNEIVVLLGAAGRKFMTGASLTLQCTNGCLSGVSLGVGDLNGDGKLDFAAVGDNEVLTYLGNGNGTFANAGAAALSPLYQNSVVSTTVSIMDMNSDGIGDVVIAPSNGLLPILLGRGNGSLARPLYFPVNGPLTFPAVPPAIGYFNPGPSLDIIVPAGGGFARLLNTGYNTWPTVASLGPAPAP
jgi:FG-GAP-like repeat/FG-GAP repeat